MLHELPKKRRFKIPLEVEKRKRKKEDERRIALGEFKDKLTASLKLDEDEGETEAFLRRGYQRMTWWEEVKDREEKSDDWRR